MEDWLVIITTRMGMHYGYVALVIPHWVLPPLHLISLVHDQYIKQRDWHTQCVHNLLPAEF